MHRLVLIALTLLPAPGTAGSADRTAPRLDRLSASSGSTPYAGDTRLLTTISPNGDGFRDAARISFTLSEPATVTLEIDRTVRTPQPVFTETAQLPAGPHALVWAPAPAIGPRTYLVRLTAIDAAGNRRTYGAHNALAGSRPSAPIVRVQGVDAAFTRQSYAPGERARVRIATDATALTLQPFRAGPETEPTYPDNVMNGVPAGNRVRIDWSRRRDRPEAIRFGIGAWPTGLYYLQLTADDGRLGYAPFVVRPARFGASRVAVVLPTNTWQAYNFYDANGDGWGDTWYAGPPHQQVALGRPFLRRGVPPFFRRYDLGFLHWLAWQGKAVDYLADSDLAYVPTGDALAQAYDLVVFPGHEEYVTEHARDIVERYRDLGGNLMFLSANSFFWRVRAERGVLTRTGQFRQLDRPEAALLGVQYRANDEGRRRGAFVVRNAASAPWLWQGTGLADGSTFEGNPGGYGIEIDSTTAASPPGTLVVAEIPDLFGPGVTAQMTYYETAAGAKVFAAGALDFGGSATTSHVRRLLENLWARLAAP